MARLTQLTAELKNSIQAAWAASLPKMFDGERSNEALIVPLIDETDTQWYSLPNGAFMLLRNTVAGDSAFLQFLSLNPQETIPELESARTQIIEAMNKYELRRINVTYPTTLEWRDFKLLGFKHEGRIRKSIRFSGEWIDAEILGVLENEIGVSRRRRRKRQSKSTEKNNASARKRSYKPAPRARSSNSRPTGELPSGAIRGGDSPRESD